MLTKKHVTNSKSEYVLSPNDVDIYTVNSVFCLTVRHPQEVLVSHYQSTVVDQRSN